MTLLGIYQLHGAKPELEILVTKICKPENIEQLRNLRISTEQWASIHHFYKNTTYRPQVDWSRIVARPKKNFRCSIRQGNNLKKE